MPLAPAATDLTTLANVKAWVGVVSGGEDDLVQRLLTATSITVLNYLNRQIASQAYTGTFSGNGLPTMMLANYPITAVASLSIDGIAVPARTSQGTGYAFDRDTIYLSGSCFRRGVGNVSVQYTAGYASTPFDLEQAVIELVALRYKERDHIGHVSKSIQGETVSYLVKAMPDDVKAILDQYRRVTPAPL